MLKIVSVIDCAIPAARRAANDEPYSTMRCSRRCHQTRCGMWCTPGPAPVAIDERQTGVSDGKTDVARRYTPFAARNASAGARPLSIATPTPTPAASASAPAASSAVLVEPAIPVRSTPVPAPRPAHTPIQYHAPIAASVPPGALLPLWRGGRRTPASVPYPSGGLVSNDSRPLLVFFTSRRSGPARRMESLLAHIARKERDALSIKRVDVDERPDLAKRFYVSEVPSLALVHHKRVVATLAGRATAPKIESMLDPFLGRAA